MAAEDNIRQNLQQDKAVANSTVLMQFPAKSKDSYAIFINPDEGTTYRRTIRFFDANTQQELQGGGVYAKPFANAPLADKINRMNYDIHVGAVLGLPGKILAFFASLICASLPITGFMIWLGRKKKKKLQPAAHAVKIEKNEIVLQD